jgi:hypothetical protein
MRAATGASEALFRRARDAEGTKATRRYGRGVMVLAAGRAYSSAKRLVRATRPRRIDRVAFARRAFGGSFASGILVLGLIALASPARFGQPGASTLRTGWPSIALLVAIGLCLLAGLARRRHLLWLGGRVREPLLRPLEEVSGFYDAVEALEACPAPLRTRFALSWVWGPVATAVLGGTFAFSAAYFVVDAILARGRVGWAQPVYALAFTAASLVVFALGAGRFATWRVAASVHREATTGYPA